MAQLNVHDLGAGFWILASNLPALLSTPPLTGGAVQLLPSLDGYIMGYRDRRRFLDSEHYDQVFDRWGNAFNSVWMDGRVVGIWREVEDGVECLVWRDEHTAEVASAAQSLGRFLRQGDTGEPTKTASVTVRPYPAQLYVKTPFTLGRR